MKLTLTSSLLVAGVLSSPLADPQATYPTQPAKVSTVYAFPTGTWLENIDQRSSGELLVTELHTPRLWQVDPKKPASQAPVLVANIAGKSGLLGITEFSQDVFAVVAASNYANGTTVPKSNSVYKVDLTKTPAAVSKVADLPDALILNGITFVPGSVQSAYAKGLLLTTDSALGAIWAIDVATSKVDKWSQDYLMRPCPPQNLGINGIKFNGPDSRVYFTNTLCDGGYLASQPLSKGTGRPAGAAAIVGGKSQATIMDDLSIDASTKQAYVAAANQVDVIDLVSGAISVVAGAPNSGLIAQSTAVKIGRTLDDVKQGLIYVSTAGMVGQQVVAGQVLAVRR